MPLRAYSTVTDLAKLRGLSTSVPTASAVWYDSSCTGIVCTIGDSTPVGLMDMIAALEAALGVEAHKVMRPMQPGDVTATYADISKLNALCGYQPKVPLKIGLEKFVAWWRQYENG